MCQISLLQRYKASVRSRRIQKMMALRFETEKTTAHMPSICPPMLDFPSLWLVVVQLNLSLDEWCDNWVHGRRKSKGWSGGLLCAARTGRDHCYRRRQHTCHD